MNIAGAVEGRVYQPCDEPGTYVITVPNTVLYFATPELEPEDHHLLNPMYQEVLAGMAEGQDPLPDWNIDLFQLKQECIQQGIFEMNSLLAEAQNIPEETVPGAPEGV